jgi:5-hydroxyisourate hydrolase
MSLSTHVLDTAAGRPAAGVPLRLETAADGSGGPPVDWRLVTEAVTDGDGRVRDLPATEAGWWRLIFDTSARSAFFPEVTITFVIHNPTEHHHVPLLLAPYAFTTYRGS